MKTIADERRKKLIQKAHALLDNAEKHINIILSSVKKTKKAA